MVKDEKMALRKASLKYGIPKSTLFDHYSGKVKGCKRGPSTVLSEVEEDKLAQWAINMSEIDYGRTREQVIEMVKTILEGKIHIHLLTIDQAVWFPSTASSSIA